MADWRQIQARIRKAKTSSDPPGQLAELYQRTRDAMVAFELAQWHEKAGNASEMVQWYTTAAQRFRRAQWRTKAQEALARLGAPIPEAGQAPLKEPGGAAFAGEAVPEEESAGSAAEVPYSASAEVEPDALHAGNGHMAPAVEAAEEPAEASAAPSAPSSAAGAGKRRRRGRRGGRKRRGRGGAGQQEAAESAVERSVSPESRAEPAAPSLEAPVETSPTPFRGGSAGSASQGGVGGLVSSRPRAGDPGLSSRIAQLESQLRRLLACPLASLAESDEAPAGPGVLLLSDSDQVTHYYVEACQTLRIGIGNLLRGGRGGGQLKAKLAEHLGISESRVAKYLKDHCGVRWLQLDEGAAALAHFATAVLRPVVAE
jgi:hypothetical protein